MIEMTGDDWKALATWALTGNVGLSSEFMARYIIGLTRQRNADLLEVLSPGRIAYPHDSADFGRCWKLVKAVPKLREGFPQLREVHPIWRLIVDHWDNMGALLEDGWRVNEWGTFGNVWEVTEILHNFREETANA